MAIENKKMTDERIRCSCTHEAGGSKCEAHPSCAGCGRLIMSVFDQWRHEALGNDIVCKHCYDEEEKQP